MLLLPAGRRLEFSPMASRCRSVYRPLLSCFSRATGVKSTAAATRALSPLPSPRLFPRSVREGCCALSLLPLHSAVASARLTSRLGNEPRSLSQEQGLSVPR